MIYVYIFPFLVYIFATSYRKLARDVPQSPWTVTVQQELPVLTRSNDNSTEADSTPAAQVEGNDRMQNQFLPQHQQQQRKGRQSVEEIISFSVSTYLRTVSPTAPSASSSAQDQLTASFVADEIPCTSHPSAIRYEHSGHNISGLSFGCRMHACGREDIDVRCLGNGRPFVLEVHDVHNSVSPHQLQLVLEHINSRLSSLNENGDVEVTLLRQCGREVWEGMQKVAEEKKKGYCCVVWTAANISSKDVLQNAIDTLVKMHQDNVDEEGVQCIKVNSSIYFSTIFFLIESNPVLSK